MDLLFIKWEEAQGKNLLQKQINPSLEVWDQLPPKGVDIRNQNQMKHLMEQAPMQCEPQLGCNPPKLNRDELSLGFYPGRKPI